MNVVVHTDTTIAGFEPLRSRAASDVAALLAQYDRVVRVEVHLSDESAAHLPPNDIRCVLEAFVEGQSPTVATERASTVDEAVRGAAHELERVIETRLAGDPRAQQWGRDSHPTAIGNLESSTSAASRSGTQTSARAETAALLVGGLPQIQETSPRPHLPHGLASAGLPRCRHTPAPVSRG